MLVALPGANFAVFGPRQAYNLAQTKVGLQVYLEDRLALFADFPGEFRFYGQGRVGVCEPREDVVTISLND